MDEHVEQLQQHADRLARALEAQAGRLIEVERENRHPGIGRCEIISNRLLLEQLEQLFSVLFWAVGLLVPLEPIRLSSQLEMINRIVSHGHNSDPTHTRAEPPSICVIHTNSTQPPATFPLTPGRRIGYRGAS